jgi:hypothetical protein
MRTSEAERVPKRVGRHPLRHSHDERRRKLPWTLWIRVGDAAAEHHEASITPACIALEREVNLRPEEVARLRF